MKSTLLTLLIALAVVIMTSVGCFSQELAAPTTIERIESPLTAGNGLQFGGWLDPQRFSMTHSYGLTFTRWGGQSFNYGIYTNRMEYRVSNPLTLSTTISVLHQPFTMLNGGLAGNGLGVLSSFQLEYRPSENMRMMLDVQMPVMPRDSQFRTMLFQPDWRW